MAEAEDEAARQSQEFLDQRQKEREDAQKQIDEFNAGAITDQRQKETLDLQEHYNTLLGIADEYGIDTAELKKSQAEQLAAINKKFAEEEAQKEYETAQKRLEALSGLFTGFGDLVTASFDLLAGEGEKSSAFQKVATLATIAFDTASFMLCTCNFS